MKEERREMLDAKITLHDRHRFEMKLDVDLIPGKKNVYRVETYFFIPRAMNVNPETYTKSVFYNSFQKYIRFKTPQMSLDKIADETVAVSPLNRISAGLKKILSGSNDDKIADSVYGEIKLLGCVVRGSVRDYVKFLSAEIISAGSSPNEGTSRFSAIEENGLGFASDVKKLISRIRALKTEISNPAVPARLREGFGFFDEFLSLTLVDYLALLLEDIRCGEGSVLRLSELDKALSAIVNAQNGYRRTMGYPSVVQKGSGNETLVYRRSVLKKFVSSVLHLQMETTEWQGAFQIFFGLAAGVAMLFTVLLLIFAQSRFAANSAPFVVIVVVSYIFKDRIKDWLKLWFTASWTKWIADRGTSITDPYSGQNIGVIKEAFSFVSDEAVPPEVSRGRNIDNITSVEEEGKPERVVKYEREVSLYPSRVSEFHERRRDLNDILRFNIVPLIAQADDPIVDYLNLNEETGQLETLRCKRVYHINVVTKYSASPSNGGSVASLERIRIILTRDGIERLEKVPV